VAADRYVVDQRYGTIDFSVDQLGIFSAHGTFHTFRGDLSLDFAQSEKSRVEVDVDAGSADMAMADAEAMLRSPPYFDVDHFPRIHFSSAGVEPLTPTHFLIHGALQIRGVTQPETLDATLVDRHRDPALNADVAYFVVKGELRRSAFGMVANQDFIADTISLLIRIHLQLGASAHEGG
jgi:polyisoprenoid-binding protein YceI